MDTRRVLVLGATGPTGRHVVSQALERGHAVTVLVRARERVGPGADRARVVIGALPGDTAALDEAMRGQDAVISVLGVGNALRAHGLIARSTPAILNAMARHGVRRLVFTSAYGVGPTRADVPLLPRILMRLLLHDIYADKLAGDDAVRASDLDWTIVQPVTLTNGPRTGRCRVAEQLPLRGVPRISRADVAAVLVAQLDDAGLVRRTVLASG